MRMLSCSCGATTPVSNRKYRRMKGKYINCRNCGAPIKIGSRGLF